MISRLVLALTTAVVANQVAAGEMMAAPTPLERAFAAPVVVVGKVASVEAEGVEADGRTYRIALVKVADALSGAKGLTHVKVGFQNPPDGNVRRRDVFFPLKQDQEVCLFLTKHPKGDFLTYDYMSQPLFATAPNYSDEVARMKKALVGLADPMKALKAENAEDRYTAAVGLVSKYRAPLPNGEQVAIPADERVLIYAALLESDWAKPPAGVPAAPQVVWKLISTEAGGFKPANFGGNGDYSAFMKAEFKKWVAGDGARFELKKYAPKTAK